MRAQYPLCVVMSAKRPEAVAKLNKTIVEFFQKDLVEAELFLPWTAQNMRGEIYANCQVLGERSEDEGAYFQIRGEPNVVNGLQVQLGQGKL